MRKTKEGRAAYMRERRATQKAEKLKNDKERLKFCFPVLDTDNYSEEDWNREIEYMNKLISKSLEKKQFIIDYLKKYTPFKRSDITQYDIMYMIKNENLRLSQTGGLQLVNIYNAPDEILHI